jgi:hypothetical protein
MQALGEVLVEGDSGGRLLGCSPNVAMLLAAKIKRAQSQGAAAQNAAPSTPQKGAVAPPGSGGGGSASKMVGLPGVGVGAGDLRCDVLYSLSEKGAVTFCSAELEATLGKVSKAENAFAARLQTLVDRHESELLIADADPAGAAAGGASGGGVTPGVAARQQAAAFALETRLHTLMHSYVGGALEFSLLAPVCSFSVHLLPLQLTRICFDRQGCWWWLEQMSRASLQVAVAAAGGGAVAVAVRGL